MDGKGLGKWGIRVNNRGAQVTATRSGEQRLTDDGCVCLARVFPSDWEPEMDVLTDKPHRRSLLEHLSAVPDPRQAWRVAHPLPEVLLLVVCGTIAANDDYDDIVDWGEAHLSFLRRFSG